VLDNAQAGRRLRPLIIYRAKSVALTSIDSALEHATDARSRFLGLWFSEETPENEQREWLRLMLEAEWFA
jgi:hypothetical protein